jgi:hypothetical protein
MDGQVPSLLGLAAKPKQERTIEDELSWLPVDELDPEEEV